MMPPKAKKTIPMPKAPANATPNPTPEPQPQLVVVDSAKLDWALTIAYEILAEKPALRSVLSERVGLSIIGKFASSAQDEGQ
jgi:hypothetical protein